MDFDRLCMIFTMQEPFYGILLSAMNRKPVSFIDTLGVAQSGNVFQLFYNPKFLEDKTEEQIMYLLKHEVLHVAFNHFSIWDTPSEKQPKYIQQMRQLAADLEVNSYLPKEITKQLGGMLPEAFGFNENEGTREYYRLLENFFNQQQRQQQKQKAKGSPNKPCNGGQTDNNDNQNQDEEQQEQSQGQGRQGNSSFDDEMQQELPEEITSKGNMLDDHTQWPGESNDADIQAIQQQVEDLLDFAAVEVEKSRGEIPAEMKMRIEQIRSKKKARPVADWKRYVRRYLGNEFSEFIRKSKKRESRRFEGAAGNRHRRKSHILVAIDTSGSVSMPEYLEFFAQIKTLLPIADFHVVECDARIAHEYEYRGKVNEDIHGGGGTSFDPPVNYFNERRKLYDALVYFTDGYAPVPDNIGRDMLWVISSKGISDIKPFFKNGSVAVKIK